MASRIDTGRPSGDRQSIILESADKILRRNLSPAEFSQISDRVDQINEAYRTVLDGDRSSLTYQPGVGSTLAINGSPAVTIEGADFARLYFKIWLGEQPISSSLRASAQSNLLWQDSLLDLGEKYRHWTIFPTEPTLN